MLSTSVMMSSSLVNVGVVGLNEQLIENVKSGASAEEKLKFIEMSGADLSAQDEDGMTALMWAARYGHLKVCKLLIESGARLKTQDTNGMTVLMWAARYGHLKVCKLLIKSGARLDTVAKGKLTAFLYAVSNGFYDIAKLLIESKANIHTRTKNGETALMCAARSGNYKICKLLVENWFDVNAKAKSGEAALMCAAKNGSFETCKFLMENGANINAKTMYGETVLMYATRGKKRSKDCLEICKLLMENGANVKAKTNCGETALTFIFRKECHEKCRTILTHAIFFPESSGNLFVVIRCLFNRFSVAKDIQYLMLAQLPLDCLMGLIYCNKYSTSLRASFISKIEEYSRDQLLPMIDGGYSQNSKLRDMRNPQLFEKNFGEERREAIETLLKDRPKGVLNVLKNKNGESRVTIDIVSLSSDVIAHYFNRFLSEELMFSYIYMGKNKFSTQRAVRMFSHMQGKDKFLTKEAVLGFIDKVLNRQCKSPQYIELNPKCRKRLTKNDWAEMIKIISIMLHRYIMNGAEIY